MDPGVQDEFLMMNQFKFGDNVVNSQMPSNIYSLDVSQFSLEDNEDVNHPYTFPVQTSNDSPGAPSSTSSGDDPSEITEINSDMLLSYISNMLMEEDMDEKIYVHEGDSALQAAEKSFSDVLIDSYLPSPDQPPLYNYSLESPDSEDSHLSYLNPLNSGDGHLSYLNHTIGVNELLDNGSYSYFHKDLFTEFPIDYSSKVLNNQNPSSDINDGHYGTEAPHGPHPDIERTQDLFFESQSVQQFNRGFEEGSKFLPDSKKFIIDIESLSLPQMPKEEIDLLEVKVEEGDHSFDNGMRGRKHRYHEDFDLGNGRSNKQSAVYTEPTVPPVLFDNVLLCGELCREDVNKLREAKENEISKNTENGTVKGSSVGKSKGKKQPKKEVVDIRTLLIHCAQSVAADDRRNANELLKQIRQHSSPEGDETQRLAHCFANGLEARLAGTGSQAFHSIMATRTTAASILKAHRLYMAACPFKKISFFFASQTILKAAVNATRLHIIDIGIGFGFQWPCFMQCLANRSGGPPILRITGIDKPLPGFRPNERIEETGIRLEGYAQRFGIPFEYHSIASKLEDIQLEDLKISKDEVLAVNCLFQLKTLPDETVMVDSPRDIVLRKILQMNPDVFIHGIMNGSFSAPFFVTRFREALFHFSALFDMFESTIPRDTQERSCIERELFGREALNVIACEGIERVQRPETYKQWGVRNRRAGFSQLLLDPDILKNAMKKFKSCYNKDFVIDTDGNWLLQGWKGRIMYGISTWKPRNAGL